MYPAANSGYIIKSNHSRALISRWGLLWANDEKQYGLLVCINQLPTKGFFRSPGKHS